MWHKFFVDEKEKRLPHLYILTHPILFVKFKTDFVFQEV